MIKKGDIVGRYSYNNDILFFVDKIIKVKGDKEKKIAILKGLNIRVEADAELRRFKKI